MLPSCSRHLRFPLHTALFLAEATILTGFSARAQRALTARGDSVLMSLEAVTILNAILDVLVVSCILALSAWAIRADRGFARAEVRARPRRERDRLAA